VGAETDDEWARTTLAQLRAASPTSLVATLRLIRAGATSELAACFARELGLATTITATHDFAEGVRAALVDKDRSPRWQPSTVSAVSDDVIGALSSQTSR
jgi:enoyl-CoA hydratase